MTTTTFGLDTLAELIGDLEADPAREVSLSLRALYRIAADVARASHHAAYRQGWQAAMEEVALRGAAAHEHGPVVTTVERDERGQVIRTIKQ